MIKKPETVFSVLFNIWDENAVIYFFDKNFQHVSTIKALDMDLIKPELYKEEVRILSNSNHKIKVQFLNLIKSSIKV